MIVFSSRLSVSGSVIRFVSYVRVVFSAQALVSEGDPRGRFEILLEIDRFVVMRENSRGRLSTRRNPAP